MEGADRLQELAEMIGGQRITDTTRAQAQELLDAARAEFVKAVAVVVPATDPPRKSGRPADPSADSATDAGAKPPAKASRNGRTVKR
jgi:hypothetical protein